MATIIAPLAWPPQRPRTLLKQEALFHQRGRAVTFTQAVSRVNLELGSRLQATDVVITSNWGWKGILEDLFRTTDAGVAIYFRLSGNPHCLSCDRWDRIPDNLCAIAKHCEAIRGQVRWGVADVAQILAGFKELPPSPPPNAEKPWWVVLGFAARPTSRAEIVLKYHALAHLHHPDKKPADGGALFREIATAYKTGIEATQ